MNLKKFCCVYGHFLVALVLSSPAISSDKQKESLKDESSSLSQFSSILIPSKPVTPLNLREEHVFEENTPCQSSFKNIEQNWQELETNYPIAYYLLQASAASYDITSRILNEVAFAKERDDTIRFQLHNNNIIFLHSIWLDLISLESLPNEFKVQEFHDLYKHIPLHQFKQSTKLDASIQINFQAHPCCYYLTQAAVFISEAR